MIDLIFKWVTKGEKPVFVSNKQEFLSIWSIAHAWEGLDPELTNEHDIPASIQAHMDMLMLAYFREEMTIRKSNGYRALGHTWLQTILGLDKEYMRLSDQLYRKNPIDKSFSTVSMSCAVTSCVGVKRIFGSLQHVGHCRLQSRKSSPRRRMTIRTGTTG